MSVARTEMLRRIRAALGDVSGAADSDDPPPARDYQRVGEARPEALVERFAERVADYRATVRRVGPEELEGAIAAACAARGVRRLVVPADLPEGWAPPGVEVLRDAGLSHELLDSCDGALTGCAVGVAQTGTIVLNGGQAQGRRAITLLPDYHLCVIRADQIVELVPEALARLAPSGRHRPLTLISGPSATSDIELSRVEGVHGPRTLEVLMLGARH